MEDGWDTVDCGHPWSNENRDEEDGGNDDHEKVSWAKEG